MGDRTRELPLEQAQRRDVDNGVESKGLEPSNLLTASRKKLLGGLGPSLVKCASWVSSMGVFGPVLAFFCTGCCHVCCQAQGTTFSTVSPSTGHRDANAIPTRTPACSGTYERRTGGSL
jgi:hypothetical protein